MEVLAIVSIVISLIGAVGMIAFNVPALDKIRKTKDTSSLSLWMFIILAAGSFMFVASTIITMVLTANKNDASSVDIYAPIGVLIGNLFSCASSIAIACIKARNSHMAKKNNISEREWCDKLLKEYNEKKNKK